MTWDELPHTQGFFFGESDGSEKPDDLRILQAALDWWGWAPQTQKLTRLG